MISLRASLAGRAARSSSWDLCARRSASCFAKTIRNPPIHAVQCLHIQRRGAKRVSTPVKLADLPQGSLPPLDTYHAEKEFSAPQYPAVIQGAKNNMLKFKNCVLFTRVGSFYEMYFEHAEEFAPAMNLKVGQKKTALGLVPIAGFPFYQLDRYLKILVEDLNQSVAISEEFANDTSDRIHAGGLMFNRMVTRVVTPGTLIDEKFMDPHQSNYLLAIYIKGGEVPLVDELTTMDLDTPVGLSWLDLSTGEFNTQLIKSEMLPSAIARISAREVLVDENLDETSKQHLKTFLGPYRQLLTSMSPVLNSTTPLSDWNSHWDIPVSKEKSATFSAEEIASCNMLLEYVRTKMRERELKLQSPKRKETEAHMVLDRHSLKGLEVMETTREGFGKGSLLYAIKKTSTSSGTRLLKDRLTSPSTSVEIINQRLDLVSTFHGNDELREYMVSLLKRSYDAQRLLQKFVLGRGGPDDLISLSKTIQATKDVHAVLTRHMDSLSPSEKKLVSLTKNKAIGDLLGEFELDGPMRLVQDILDAIDEDGLSQKQRIEEDLEAEAVVLAEEVISKDGTPEDLNTITVKARKQSAKGRSENGTVNVEAAPESSLPEDTAWVMRRDASPKLERLHQFFDELQEERVALTHKLREVAGTPGINVKSTSGLGYIVHVRGTAKQKSVSRIADAFPASKVISQSKSTCSFYLPSWTQLGARIDEVKYHIRVEEQAVFEELRRSVIENLVKLRRNAAIMDELDVSCAFAKLAQEQQLIRPIVNESTNHKIVGGRHPTVKLGLEEKGRTFVGNDCFLDHQERIWLITGPNMAGKSTFLRQNALITILAQAGSYVPADYAELGIVDRVFSRIGAADDIFRDQSTFMVEMLETAAILKEGTPRSFVIMDEIGRGTTPRDGTAVAFACLRHLHYVNKSRTLFATHFHDLTDLASDFEHLAPYCTNIQEEENGKSFYFDHRLKRGVNRDSHAFKIARLAGLPDSVIQQAKELLARQDALGVDTVSDNMK